MARLKIGIVRELENKILIHHNITPRSLLPLKIILKTLYTQGVYVAFARVSQML